MISFEDFNLDGNDQAHLFFVELTTASLDRLASPADPKFSFELLAKFELLANEEDRLSWKEDRWLATLLRFALLFLMFSRELDTDFGGSMLVSRFPPNPPGSDN